MNSNPILRVRRLALRALLDAGGAPRTGRENAMNPDNPDYVDDARRYAAIGTYPQMSSNQRAYAEFIAAHPGSSVADVVRACRRNPAAGHAWIYDGVARLIQQRVLRTDFRRGRHHLYVVEG